MDRGARAAHCDHLPFVRDQDHTTSGTTGIGYSTCTGRTSCGTSNLLLCIACGYQTKHRDRWPYHTILMRHLSLHMQTHDALLSQCESVSHRWQIGLWTPRYSSRDYNTCDWYHVTGCHGFEKPWPLADPSFHNDKDWKIFIIINLYSMCSKGFPLFIDDIFFL